MASDLNHLNPAQQAWLEKITQYGIKTGYGVEVTQAVVMLALQESDLGKYQHNLSGSSGQGLFQYMGPENLQNALTGYRTNHPEAKYAKLKAEQVFQNNDATMHVMFDQVERWKQEFALGYLPDGMRNKLQDHMLKEKVFNSFKTYAYYNHNTSVAQTYERLNAENGITASADKVNKYIELAYQNAQNSFASYKIPASKVLKASADLHVLHAGPGHVILPNGFEVTLTGKNDLVIGIGNTYLIAQGKNQKYVSFENGRMVEIRPTAFRDSELNNQSLRAAAGSMVLNPDGSAVVNTADHKIAPFKLAGHGYPSAYANAKGEPLVEHKPPLHKVKSNQHDVIFNQQLAMNYEDGIRIRSPQAHANQPPLQLALNAEDAAAKLHATISALQKSLTGSPEQNAAVMKLALGMMHQQLGTREEPQHKG